VALIAVAALAHDVKSILAIGSMVAGTPWCVSTMRSANREIFAAELLLLAAGKPDADLGELVCYCYEMLRKTAASKDTPQGDATETKPVGVA
jgi:hypothetical protein